MPMWTGPHSPAEDGVGAGLGGLTGQLGPMPCPQTGAGLRQGRSTLTPRWGPKRQKREAACQKLREVTWLGDR